MIIRAKVNGILVAVARLKRPGMTTRKHQTRNSHNKTSIHIYLRLASPYVGSKYHRTSKFVFHTCIACGCNWMTSNFPPLPPRKEGQISYYCPISTLSFMRSQQSILAFFRSSFGSFQALFQVVVLCPFKDPFRLSRPEFVLGSQGAKG
jgi:hypothetical protein